MPAIRVFKISNQLKSIYKFFSYYLKRLNLFVWVILKTISSIFCSKFKIKLKDRWCPGVDLNYRHADFQSAALPLSYPGTFVGYLNFINLSNSNYPTLTTLMDSYLFRVPAQRNPRLSIPKFYFLACHLEKNLR